MKKTEEYEINKISFNFVHYLLIGRRKGNLSKGVQELLQERISLFFGHSCHHLFDFGREFGNLITAVHFSLNLIIFTN